MIDFFKNSITYLSGLSQEKKVRSIANYRIADKYERIYFYHIRKAAGKSVTDSIMALEGKDHYNKYGELYSAVNHRIIYNDKVFVGWHPFLIQQGYYYYAFSHLPFHKLKIPENTFTLTCLRDPLERVFSYYNMLKRFREKDGDSNVLKKETKYLGTSITDFLKNIPKYRILNQLYMFSKNYSISEAIDRILGLSYFFFVEDMENGIRTLGNKLNFDLNPLHTDKAEKKESIPKDIVNQLMDTLEPEYRMIEQLKNHST